MVNINITNTKEVHKISYEDWLAFLDKIEDCTCEPGDALLCPSCRGYNRKKYGDTIPFRGE